MWSNAQKDEGMKGVPMEKTEKAAVISAAGSAIFAGVLLFLAVLLHSVNFFAGGFLAVSRSVTGFLVAAGIRLSRKHTVNFSSGLYKLENLVVTAIGTLVIFGGYQLGKVVFLRMKTGDVLMTGSEIGIPALLSASLVAFMMSVYKNRVGKEENSPSLCADGRHSLIDGAAMFVIALGVGLSTLGLRAADYVAALLVALLVIFDGGRIVVDGIKVLLDASVERSLLDEVERIVRRDPSVRDVQEVAGRNSGSYRFFFLKLVPVQNEVQAIATLTGDLKTRIRKEIRNTDEVSIEYSTERDCRRNVAVPLDNGGFYRGSELTGALFIAMFDIDTQEGKTFHVRTIPNPFRGSEGGDGVRLAVMVARQGVDAFVVGEPLKDRDVRYTLEAYGIDVLFVSVENGRSDLEAILRGAAKRLEKAEGSPS
jgi:cation diffusion facilitator family transporter